MNRNDIRYGMIVECDSGRWANRAWKVIKINPRTIKLQDSNGNILSADAHFLRESTLPFTTAVVERFVLGSVVNFRGEKFVVIKMGSALDTYNLAKLGGDGNRFYRSVPAARLTTATV